MIQKNNLQRKGSGTTICKRSDPEQQFAKEVIWNNNLQKSDAEQQFVKEVTEKTICKRSDWKQQIAKEVIQNNLQAISSDPEQQLAEK